MIGKLLERLFVQVRADLSGLSTDLQKGVRMTQTGTNQMAAQWTRVSSSIEAMVGDLQKGIITQGQYMSQMNKHASAVSKLGGTYQQAQKQVFGYAQSVKAASAAMAVANTRAFSTKPIQGFTRSAGMARMQMLNLGFQVNDIAQTLATGMNPFTVMAQQGSQIVQIYAGQGGLKTALGDISKMFTRIAARLWPLAIIAGGFALLTREINKTSDVQVSFMDTVKATFQVIGGTIWKFIKGPVQAIVKAFNWVADQVVAYFKWATNTIISSFVFAYNAITKTWSLLPGAMGDIVALTVNSVIEGTEFMVNAAISKIQGLLDLVNQGAAALGLDKVFEDIGTVDLSQFKMQVGNSAADVGKIISEEFESAFSTDFMGQFFSAIKDQAVENALARIAAGVEDVGGAAKRAAKEVKDMMKLLDEQLTTAADNLAQVFGSAFERLADTGRFTFSDFIKDLNKLIIRSTSELLQQELSNMFKTLAVSRGGLGSMLSNLFTGLFGGGGVGFGIQGRARGGAVMPWRNFVAGEEGPEFVRQDGPSAARHVSTAGRTRHMMNGMGGRPVSVVMNIQTPDAQSFQKSQGQIAAQMGSLLQRGRRNR